MLSVVHPGFKSINLIYSPNREREVGEEKMEVSFTGSKTFSLGVYIAEIS